MNNIERIFQSVKTELLQESILDSPKKNISKELFQNGKLKESIRKEVINIFDDWKDRFIPKAEIKGMYLLGSMTTFQYTDVSDIDINITTNLSDRDLKIYFKLLPNGNLLNNTKHPINFYLTNETSGIDKSPALYDLMNGKWIREPSKDDMKVPKNYVLEVARFFISGIENRITEYEIDSKELEFMQKDLKDEESELDKDELVERIALKEEEIRADLDAISIGHKMIWSFRKEAFKEDYEPEFLIDIQMKGNPNKSVNNLIYKEFERLGFFKKLEKYENIRKKMLEKQNGSKVTERMV